MFNLQEKGIKKAIRCECTAERLTQTCKSENMKKEEKFRLTQTKEVASTLWICLN